METSTTLRLPVDMKQRLALIAARERRSTHWCMREAVTEYVEREERLEAERQELLASWRDYQETGLHLTFEEVKEWLAKWGEDNIPELPPCHT